jgi:hypothetical protein
MSIRARRVMSKYCVALKNGPHCIFKPVCLTIVFFLTTTTTNNRQFEMLKVHYYNLVNEIQETAMMLNICEQHQLVLQQQQQQEETAAVANTGQHLPVSSSSFPPPGGPEPPLVMGRGGTASGGVTSHKRPVPTDGSFEISVPIKIVKL